MVRLLICSEADNASVNIRNSLMSACEWESVGGDGVNSYLAADDDVIMTIPGMHIYAEDIDESAREFGIDADHIVFMSRHKAASGIPTLTVHPIGNYNEADFGGIPEKVVKAPPMHMTEALRNLSKIGVNGFDVSYEVTHHGPWVSIPTYFIEIGSDETTWDSRPAADAIAKALLSIEPNDHLNAIGIGGGHYAPRFTEIARKFDINFGHMVPNYAIDGRSADDILGIVNMAAEATDTRLVYMHRKSMRKQNASDLNDLLESSGFEIISSKDLDVRSE